jgi:hypothetical protein
MNKKEKVLESDDSKLSDRQALLRAYRRLWREGKTMSEQENNYMEIHDANVKRKSKGETTRETSA